MGYKAGGEQPSTLTYFRFIPSHNGLKAVKTSWHSLIFCISKDTNDMNFTRDRDFLRVVMLPSALSRTGAR